MIVKSTLVIGSAQYEFQVEEKNDKDALFKAIGLATPREYCDVCKDDGLGSKSLTANKAKGEKGEFIYIKIRCKCGATSTMGEYQTGGYFWKPFELYKDNRSSKELEQEEFHN